MHGVAGLTTPAARRRGLGSWRLGVGMFGTGRHRGVARGLVELVLQLPDRGKERADDGLRFRRLAGDQFFRDFQRHACHVAENRAGGQADSRKNSPRAVDGYGKADSQSRGRSGGAPGPVCNLEYLLSPPPPFRDQYNTGLSNSLRTMVN
jgi:hypothetical protein